MSNQEHELNFEFGNWYYPSVLMGRVLCENCDEEFSPVPEANISISNPNNWFTLEIFSDEQGYFFADLPAEGMYRVMISKNGYSDYSEYVSVQGYTEIDFYINADNSGGDGYAMLKLEDVTASPGSEISVPLILESDLIAAGVQFSVSYASAIGSYLYPSDLNSMDDCFTANFNDLNGEFIGIIFSLEGCTYPSEESVHIADLIFEVSDNVPSGLETFLNFTSTLVSDVNGNEILSYGEGANVLFGLQGDANSDGFVNILDVVIIVNFAIYVEEPTDSQFWASDINGDGLINILDIVLIVNLILDN